MVKAAFGTGNKDLESFFPFVAKAAQTITNANEFVKKLVVCVFVQIVVKRTCYLIVDNMYKFVDDAAAKLEPLATVHASMSALSPVTERVSPEAQKHYSRLWVACESPALAEISSALTRFQRQSGGSHTKLLFDH